MHLSAGSRSERKGEEMKNILVLGASEVKSHCKMIDLAESNVAHTTFASEACALTPVQVTATNVAPFRRRPNVK